MWASLETPDGFTAFSSMYADGASIHPPFIELLKKQYAKYQQKSYPHFPDANQRLEDFVADLNEEMTKLAGRNPVRRDAFHPVGTDTINAILKGKAGPTPEMLEAMPYIFNCYGDEREYFLKVGAISVQEEKVRRKAAWLANTEGSEKDQANRISVEELDIQTAAIEQAKDRIIRNRDMWRSSNPKGMKEKPSFQEMLEVSNSKGEDFIQFLFKRVLPTWNNMSQLAFCDHLQKLNQEKQTGGKAQFTDTVLSSWHMGKTKPLRDSVDVICRAFGMVREEGEDLAKHERMLWKTINGHAFKWNNKKGVLALEKAIEDTKKGEDSGPLFTELMEASGIRYERLHEIMDVQQLSQWKKGAKINNVHNAVKILKLLNPEPSEAATNTLSRQNRELASLLTGRQFDIEQILLDSDDRGNPAGALLTALVGGKGLVTIGSQDMVREFTKMGLPCTEIRSKKMRASNKLERGGKIHEAYARAIMGMVADEMAPLVEIGLCKPFTDEQKERCVDVMTRVSHPKKMLAQAVEGKFSVGTLLRKACERIDLNLMGEDSLCSQIGLTTVSDFVTGKASLEKPSAERIANWLGERFGFTDEEKKQFMVLAMGVELQRTPDMIIDDLKISLSGKVPTNRSFTPITRAEALRQIYDRTGMTRKELAREAMVKFHTIQYSTTETSGGRIIAENAAIHRIATSCGISREKSKEFLDLFSGRKVSFSAAHPKKSEETETQWQDHAEKTRSAGSWAKSVPGA